MKKYFSYDNIELSIGRLKQPCINVTSNFKDSIINSLKQQENFTTDCELDAIETTVGIVIPLYYNIINQKQNSSNEIVCDKIIKTTRDMISYIKELTGINFIEEEYVYQVTNKPYQVMFKTKDKCLTISDEFNKNEYSFSTKDKKNQILIVKFRDLICILKTDIFLDNWSDIKKCFKNKNKVIQSVQFPSTGKPEFLFEFSDEKKVLLKEINPGNFFLYEGDLFFKVHNTYSFRLNDMKTFRNVLKDNGINILCKDVEVILLREQVISKL